MPDPFINLYFEDELEDDESEDNELEDDESEDNELEEKRKLDNFMEDLPTTLSPCSVGIRDSATHSPTTTTNQGISDNIKSMLLHSDLFVDGNGVLIQFWAPIKTETGCLQLVTSDQPFGISRDLDERLLKYRKHCLDYKFNVDAEEEQHLGIPGRVFRQKWHECTPDVRYYSTKDYPQRNFAQTCNIISSLVFPVFHTSIQECVGVLEFVTTDTDFTDICLISEFLDDEVESAGLKTSFYCDCLDYRTTLAIQVPNIYEIKKGLKEVCTTHNLPLALTWVPCKHSNVLHIAEKEYPYLQAVELNELRQFWSDLQKGQGVVGKAYLLHKLCFCRDITQFTQTQFPLLPSAHRLELTVCFAICLQTTCTGNYDIILEFFLHPQNKYGEDPTTFLCSILQTMKKHFPSFKLPSGEELGKELSIEFIEPPMNQEPVPGVLHNGRDQNNVPVTCSDEARMNQEPHFSQCQSTISPPGLQFISSGQEMTQARPPNQQQLSVQVDDNATLDEASMNHEHASFQCQSTASLLNNGQETMKPQSSNQQPKDFSNITREELIEHFGKKLEDVAQLYDVSRSTFKRKCREFGIKRWKSGKRNKDNGSTSRQDDPPYSNLPATDAHTTLLVTPPPDPPYSNLPATDAHTTPLVTPPPEVRTLTIIAKYGVDVIKFKLPSSSTMVELEEKVTKRLKLNSGTYKIKYNDGKYLILIACDEDLQDCLDASNSLGTIEMFIEPITLST